MCAIACEPLVSPLNPVSGLATLTSDDLLALDSVLPDTPGAETAPSTSSLGPERTSWAALIPRRMSASSASVALEFLISALMRLPTALPRAMLGLPCSSKRPRSALRRDWRASISACSASSKPIYLKSNKHWTCTMT